MIMPKRKAMARREASGKIRRPPPLPSPLEVVRLRDAALAGMRDAVWGSALGWLFLCGKINASEFAAGRNWLMLATDYAQACQSPRPPGSAVLDAMGGTSPDPDSLAGLREARREALAVENYMEALLCLKRYPSAVLTAVQSCCEQSSVPGGLIELKCLKIGLGALVECDRLGRRR
jgi:hypothetical protein